MPKNSAPIGPNGYFTTGLVTTRNPLREGAQSRMQSRYYGNNSDSIWDGVNTEISSKLTLIRRPGQSVYNPNNFHYINGFYEFSPFTTGSQNIKILATTATTVEECTGLAGTVTASGTGVTWVSGDQFPGSLGTGKIIVDGSVYTIASVTDARHLVLTGSGIHFLGSVNVSLPSSTNVTWFSGDKFHTNWAGMTITINAVDYVVDRVVNDTLLLLTTLATGNASPVNYSISPVLTNVDYIGGVDNLVFTKPTNSCTVTVSGQAVQATVGSFSTDWVQGITITIQGVDYTLDHVIDTTHLVVTSIPVAQGSGKTFTTLGGAGQTTFQQVGNILFMGDGANQTMWNGQGQATPTGLPAPDTAPTAVNTPITPPYSTWTSNTFYFPIPIITTASNGYWELTNGAAQTVATTSIAEPTWASGSPRTDGSAIWTVTDNGLGAATLAWRATHAYTAYDTTATVGSIGGKVVVANVGSTATFFVCTTAGTSASSPPTWVNGTVLDGTVVWQSAGVPITWNDVTGSGTATGISNSTLIVDSNNNVEQVYTPGWSGNSAPVWATNAGGQTPEPTPATGSGAGFTLQWSNAGPLNLAPVGTGAYQYAYALEHVETALTPYHVGTASPRSLSITKAANSTITVQGYGVQAWDTSHNQFGVVSTSSTTVTYVSGNAFDTAATNPNWLPGASISIHNVSYTIASVTNSGSLVLTSSAGTQSNVRYAVGPASTLQIYRTVQGGSTLFLLTEITNPGPGVLWTVSDSSPDSALNQFIEAEEDGLNDPPPIGLTNLAYHADRVWGVVGNVVYRSGGPDTFNGDGHQAFSVDDFFTFPSTVLRLWPQVSGIVVFTSSGDYLIQGQGTSTSAFYAIPFVNGAGTGILSYNAFTQNGAAVFIVTPDKKVIYFDPASGVADDGFPISTQISALSNLAGPDGTYLAWHSNGSLDTALYLVGATRTTTGTFQGSQYRMNQTSAPESGLNWSPQAFLNVNGTSAVVSIESSPGIRKLIYGPATAGSIQFRDTTVNTDTKVESGVLSTVVYDAYATVGSLVLAQPGQLAGVEFIETTVPATSVSPTITMWLDEISTLANASSGITFTLAANCDEPPELNGSVWSSKTMLRKRAYVSQSRKPAICQDVQIKFDFGSVNSPDELWSYTLYGSVRK